MNDSQSNPIIDAYKALYEKIIKLQERIKIRRLNSNFAFHENHREDEDLSSKAKAV